MDRRGQDAQLEIPELLKKNFRRGASDRRVARIQGISLNGKIAMDPLNHLLSPQLLIPLCGMLMPLGVVVAALNFAYRYQERKHKTIVDLLEKGLPVPRELLSSQRTGSPWMRALTLVGVGVGTSAFLGAMFQLDHGLWAAGLIPLAIGVAQLIALKLEPPVPEAPEPSSIDLQ